MPASLLPGCGSGLVGLAMSSTLSWSCWARHVSACAYRAAKGVLRPSHWASRHITCDLRPGQACSHTQHATADCCARLAITCLPAVPGPTGSHVCGPVAVPRCAAWVLMPVCLQAEGEWTDEKTSQIRRITAKRLLESKTSIPHYYLTVECSVDRLLALRSDLNARLAADGRKLSMNDFIIKASALVRTPCMRVSAQVLGCHMAEEGCDMHRGSPAWRPQRHMAADGQQLDVNDIISKA